MLEQQEFDILGGLLDEERVDNLDAQSENFENRRFTFLGKRDVSTPDSSASDSNKRHRLAAQVNISIFRTSSS